MSASSARIAISTPSVPTLTTFAERNAVLASPVVRAGVVLAQ